MFLRQENIAGSKDQFFTYTKTKNIFFILVLKVNFYPKNKIKYDIIFKNFGYI